MLTDIDEVDHNANMTMRHENKSESKESNLIAADRNARLQ